MKRVIDALNAPAAFDRITIGLGFFALAVGVAVGFASNAEAADRLPNAAACEAITEIYTERGADGLSAPGKELYNLCHPGEELAQN